MKDRILKFLESEHISPAEFADKIGVQRSSMSHILNGRNQPSAAFIQKMLHAFPLVNSRWLLIGEGKMNINQEMVNTTSSPDRLNSGVSSGFGSASDIKTIPVHDLFSDQSSNSNQQSDNQSAVQIIPDLNLTELQSLSNPKHPIDKESEKEEVAENQNFKTNLAGFNSSVEKEIEQILFFYKDKTFHIYKPS